MSTREEALEIIKSVSLGYRPLVKQRRKLIPHLSKLLIHAGDHTATVQRCIKYLTASQYRNMTEIQALAYDAYRYMIHFDKSTYERFELLKNHDKTAREIEPTLYCLLHEKINLSEYKNHSVLYAFIVLIDDTHTVIKFGYTSKILNRIKSLKNDYPGHHMELVGLKRVSDLSDETTFFRRINSEPGTKKYKTMIGDRSPRELYYFSPRLMELFHEFVPPGLDGKLLDLAIEQERTKQREAEVELAKIKLAYLEKEIELEKLRRRR